MEYLISVDVGTSSVRAALVSIKGVVKKVSVSPISIWSPQPEYYQQSSDDIWRSVCKTVMEVTKGVSPHRIKGIGVDATCSLVVLDKNGDPYSVSPKGEKEQNIILWMDHRAVKEAEIINATKHRLLENVGGKISLEMEVPKLLWLKKNYDEEWWNNVGLFLDLPDYLTWKMTESESRSLCSIVCKWNYDGRQMQWAEDCFEMIGLDDLKENNWSKIGSVVVNPGDPVGAGLSIRAAKDLKLNPYTQVAASMIDAHAGALALLGTKAEGISNDFCSRLGLICGTSTCHMALSSEMLTVPGVWGPYYEVVLPGKHLLEGGQSAAGQLLDYIIETHPAFLEIKSKLKTDDLGVIATYLNTFLRNEDITQATRDIHVWPDFHGNRSPLSDPDMKGMITGLTLDKSIRSLASLYAATIQALAYGTKHIIDTMVAAGKSPITTILVTGGLSKNSLYVQTHADVTQCNVLRPEETECMLLGCAMLAATAGKIYPSIEEAVRNMASNATIIIPDLNMKDFHSKKYSIFLKMMEMQLEFKRIMHS